MKKNQSHLNGICGEILVDFFFLSFVLLGISVGFHQPCYLSLGTVFSVL